MSEYLDDPALMDPDAGPQAKFNWDEDFQRHVAAIIVCDRQFTLQSLDIVKPSYFSNKAHVAIVGFVFEFFKKHKYLPHKDFIIQELKSRYKDNKSLTYYLSEVSVLTDYFQPGLEARDYLRDKILFFAKIQAVKKAFEDSLTLIGKNPESEETWGKVYEQMRKAMQVHHNFDVGVDYFKSIKERYAAKKEATQNILDLFIFGLPGIDNLITNGGYGRGEIISVVADSGVGKSVMLACITATNLLRGKKGVYISLELAENKIADRMDAILTGLPVQNLLASEHDIYERLSSMNEIDRDGDIWPLVIKQFPSGKATPNTIRAYLSQLKMMGFTPDFVVIDYVGEMALPDGCTKSHEGREQNVRDLRGMAIEEQFFVATAMQPNRDGRKDSKSERGVLDAEHLADAYGQIRPLDGCFSLNQNDSEKSLGIGRAYIMKQRDGVARYQIFLKFDKENLRITEITQEEYKRILNSLKESVSQETQIDNVAKKWKPKKDSAAGPDEIMKEVGEDAWASFKEAATRPVGDE